MTSEDFRVSEQPYCPREKVSKSITNDKFEVSITNHAPQNE